MIDPRTAVLLINTGSPDAPETGAVRRYLAEFLSDRRVVELPAWKWQPILRGIILRTRPAKSAARYRGVWTEEGSPLVAYTRRTAEALEARLGTRVVWAMCYGSPSVGGVVHELIEAGCERLVVLPMFAQYAAQTSAAAADAVFRALMKERRVPELHLIRDYHAHPAYIDALARRILGYWESHGGPVGAGGRLLMSFHGIPVASIAAGDSYERECRETAELLAKRLGLEPGSWLLAYQSRFGRDPWLEPYALPTAEALGRSGLARLDVVCPGFAADCLETIEEIDDELREGFLAAHPAREATQFHYVPALNDAPEAIEAYAEILGPALEKMAVRPHIL